MATDICTLFGADIQTKSQHFTIPSPAVLARLFDEDPRLLLCLIFCGFSQGEGCLRKCRPSAVAKYPVVDFVSASAAAIFSLESFDKRCLGVTTGTVTITTAAAEADNVFTEDAEDEPEVTDAEVEAVENGTETERKRRVRYAQLTDAEERRGVRMLLRVACASGARRADETIEALRRWQRKIGADEVVVEDSEGEEETWSKQLVRGLARRAADRFAYDRPLTYRLVMRVVITELEKVYLEGAGEGRKVMYRLQYIAKYDVLKLAIVAVMGTTFEDAVIRKLAAFVKWATSFREVGEGMHILSMSI